MAQPGGGLPAGLMTGAFRDPGNLPAQSGEVCGPVIRRREGRAWPRPTSHPAEIFG
jgi:hypothetical protein